MYVRTPRSWDWDFASRLPRTSIHTLEFEDEKQYPSARRLGPRRTTRRKLRSAVPAVPLRSPIMISCLRCRRLRTCGASKYAMNLLPSGQSSGMITRGLVTTCTIASVPVYSSGQIDSSHYALPSIIWTIFFVRHFSGTLHRPCATLVSRSCAKSFG